MTQIVMLHRAPHRPRYEHICAMSSPPSNDPALSDATNASVTPIRRASKVTFALLDGKYVSDAGQGSGSFQPSQEYRKDSTLEIPNENWRSLAALKEPTSPVELPTFETKDRKLSIVKKSRHDSTSTAGEVIREATEPTAPYHEHEIFTQTFKDPFKNERRTGLSRIEEHARDIAGRIAAEDSGPFPVPFLFGVNRGMNPKDPFTTERRVGPSWMEKYAREQAEHIAEEDRGPFPETFLFGLSRGMNPRNPFGKELCVGRSRMEEHARQIAEHTVVEEHGPFPESFTFRKSDLVGSKSEGKKKQELDEWSQINEALEGVERKGKDVETDEEEIGPDDETEKP
ncbi:hypothetical protein CC80DRAFT_508394 [Byssothecium circinans]|uniref:Uncharacterized protein n=1 Tax=Byssothecium circinans TaxID=147558 RepID=A0A6A5TI50_9PLEO|nr:hypothetical protein CC80DRAFT_508394 [Byssothecium circinans]